MVFDFLDEPLEVRDVPLRQLALPAEVGGEGRDAAGEEAIEKSLAFAQHPFVARDQRRIQETPSIFLGANCLLLQQAIQQGLDGGFLPVLLAFERGYDGFVGMGWRFHRTSMTTDSASVMETDRAGMGTSASVYVSKRAEGLRL
jgi:hypothetical protein